MIPITIDTAVELFVNEFPLIDDSDFKTREVAIAYNESNMDLVWNFQEADGTVTQTAVTPTTAGVYDWTHVGDGMYKIEVPASGGASINNDTVGVGWFTGLCDGVLPWASPKYKFGTLGDFDDLDTAQDTQHAATQSALATVDGIVDDILLSTAVLKTTITYIGDTTGTLAAGSMDNNAYHGCMALLIDQSTADQKSLVGIEGYVGATQQITFSEAPKFTYDTGDTIIILPGVSAMALHGNNGAAENLQATYDGTGYADDYAPATQASIAALNDPTAAAIATAVLTTAMTESYASDGAAPTLTQSVLATQQFLFDKVKSGTSVTIYKLDGVTSAFSLTLDDSTEPTTIYRTG